MPSEDDQSGPPEQYDLPPVPCDDCQSALVSGSRQTVSFLLLDELSIPLAGCSTHVEQFSSTCELTSEATADVLSHLPAGGIPCPSCHLAPHSPGHPVIPVGDGAVAVLACPEHQAEVASRYQAGLETRHQLTADLGTF
jgi:hypothetical protein